jgi:septal ring factor EnvC (AmiA/AmiB activator)
MDINTILAVLGSGFVMSIMTYLFTRKKTTAESVILNLDAFSKTLEIWQNAAYDVKKELELTRTENAHLMAQLAENTYRMVSLEREIDALKAVNATLMNKMMQLNDTNQELRRGMDMLRGENEKLRKQIACLNKKLSE